MGMFDYIRCEVPLPDGFEGELQTKDFGDSAMVTHIITKDGRLLTDNGPDEWVPEAERRYPNAKPGTFESMCGILRHIPKHEDANFHGIVNFYGSEGRSEDGTYRWHEYNAKFTDGQLVGIEKVATNIDV